MIHSVHYCDLDNVYKAYINSQYLMCSILTTKLKHCINFQNTVLHFLFLILLSIIIL